MLRGIESQMRRILTTPVAAAGSKFSTLANIGITTGADGKLALDKAELSAALNENPAAVTALMTSENGVAVQASTFITSKLSSTGEIAARETGIAAKRKDLTKQKEALDARMLVIQERYMKQFNALDTMLAQMQSTSSYLTQQFASLANLNNNK
jgi:flagellar hook-associated protein 2